MTERPSPTLTEVTAPFWTGGERGELRIQRCSSCGWWLHPPGVLCPRCLGRDLSFEAASGDGVVWSYTISLMSWAEELEAPYVIAEVELVEQEGLRLMTTIVDCDDLAIGLRVHVRFERAGDAWIPVFTP